MSKPLRLLLAGLLAVACKTSTSSQPPDPAGTDAAKTPADAVTLRGVVRDADGKPVDGAVVMAVDPAAPVPAALVRSGADGSFTAAVPAGRYALTATSPAGTAAYLAPDLVGPDKPAELKLGAGGFTVRGKLTVYGAKPEQVVIRVGPHTQDEGILYAVLPAPDGSYSVRLAPAPGFTLWPLAGDMISPMGEVDGNVDQTIDLYVVANAPAPDAVVAWVKAQAKPLVGVEAGVGFADLQPLGQVAGDARVVGLGEATHGSREFFQMKHRALEYLVVEKGFTLFAIEGNVSEARKVNDYVLTGRGDPAAALKGMHFWTWNTEEVLAMITWMRKHNADKKTKRKVQFVGIDMQYTDVSWPAAAAYIKRVDPKYAASLPASLELFGPGEKHAEQLAALDPAARQAQRDALAALVARLDAQKVAYTRKSRPDEWRAAREDAQVVAQFAAFTEASARGEVASSLARDGAMAENLLWTLAQEGADARAVLWAHNGHVTTRTPVVKPLGGFLREALGDRYVAVALMFSGGAFQAYDMTKPDSPFGEVVVADAPNTDAAAIFTRAGCERCVVDLRTAPAGEVRDWLAAPHPFHSVGAAYVGPDGLPQLLGAFDAAIFIRTTTRARSNPGAFE